MQELTGAERQSLSNTGTQHKLGYKTPDDVRARMSVSASRRNRMDLGIDISNQIFQDMYPTAESVGRFKPGHDFVLYGKKIDVKASTQNKTKRWHFAIHKNTIPDAFCMMLFDNAVDYNLLKVFMIPARAINHLTGVSVSYGTMSKWSEWEISPIF